MNKFSRQKGFSQIVLLVIISFLAISLPIATKLVQQSQENRSNAAVSCGSYTYGQCISQGASSCSWDSKNQRCVAKSSSTKVNGRCGSGNNSCVDGTWQDETDTSTQYKWKCLGSNGGTTASCTYGKPTPKPDTPTPVVALGKDCILPVGKDGESKCGTVQKNNLYRCDSGVWRLIDKCGDAGCGSGKCNGVDAGKSCTLPAAKDGELKCGIFLINNLYRCDGGNWRIYDKCGDAGCSSGKCNGNGPVADDGTDDGTDGFDADPDAKQTFWYRYGTSCSSTSSFSTAADCKAHVDRNCYSSQSACLSAISSGCMSGTTKYNEGYRICTNSNTVMECIGGSFSNTNCPNGCVGVAPSAYCQSSAVNRQYWFYNGTKCALTGSSYKDLNSCTTDVRGPCYGTEASCNIGNNIASMPYYFYNGSKCVATGQSYTSATLCNSDTRSKCYGTIEECNANIPAVTDPVDPGQHDDSPPAVICTANAVSTTACYDSTHLQKCNESGTAWLQGDQCATGQICSNGVCGIGTTGASKLSFKIAFDGVGSANFSCLDNFKTVKLVVGKVGTSLTEEKTVNITKLTGVGSESSKKYIIFEAKDVALGVGFSGVTNVYARIKGQVHASMYYCTKGQSTKNTSQSCDLALDGTVNNLYEYPVLGGDVNQDGKVDTTDFSLIKNDLNEEGCNYKTDLNGDGKVNGPDIKIHKTALESKYDE